MRFLFLFCFLLVSVIPLAASGQWALDGTILHTGPPLGPTNGSIVRDGTGGAIATWLRAGEIIAQRVDPSGVLEWAPGGLQVCALLVLPNNAPAIWPDGAGGAFITWQDGRNFPGTGFDIYAQWVDAAGAPQWPANGVPITTAAGEQNFPAIVADGAGGAIVMWIVSGSTDLYAQRVDASGTTTWGGGIDVGSPAAAAISPRVVPDGASGAVVVWTDARAGIGNLNIWTQRVDATGALLWGGGVTMCTAPLNQILNDAIPEGAGSVMATWMDSRTGGTDIYAQKVNGFGGPEWTADGVVLCAAAGDQGLPVLVTDGFGGAIVAWEDLRVGPLDIYAQRVNTWGTPQWAVDGIALCTAAMGQTTPDLVADGGGGAIAAWTDGRAGLAMNVFAQRVNAAGAVQWSIDGVSVTSAPVLVGTAVIASDDVGGAYVAWSDSRPMAVGLYAQRISYGSGQWGRPEAIITSVSDVAADQGGRVRVNWEATPWDVLGYTEITYYSVWRATELFPLSNLPGGSVLVDDPSRVSADFTGSAFWVEETTVGVPYYWEWLGNQAILNSPGYSFSAATRADSTLGGNADHFFQVVSHTASPFVFWRSNVATGRSVDNLAPAVPLQFTAQRLATAGPSQSAATSTPGDVLLTWQSSVESDLRHYSIYRSTSNDVQATPEFFLASTQDESYVDTTAPVAQSFYYVLTAVDVHGNSSAATGTAAVGPSTGVQNTPRIKALMVLQNSPNPFTGSTTFEIGLPAASNLSIEVYDVAGRRVRAETLAGRNAGWQRVAFDARDDAGQALPSGVYFYRVRAAGETLARKMVIAR